MKWETKFPLYQSLSYFRHPNICIKKEKNMKYSIGLISLILTIAVPSWAQTTDNSTTSNISSTHWPEMEFEQVEPQLKAFLNTNPVDLSQHFLSLCRYSPSTEGDRQQWKWGLRYESIAN